MRQAEVDGYRAIGPDIPGMGIHDVGSRSSGFDVEHREILLYERTRRRPMAIRWLAVSYLLVADTDGGGQAKNPPFPEW